MKAWEDLDRDCGTAAEVIPGRSIMVDWAASLDTPMCHHTAIDVVDVRHDPDEQMIYLTGVCGHTVRMCDDFPVTDYTQAIADLFGALVMDEAERLGVGRNGA